MDDRWGFIDRSGKLEIPTVFEGPTPRGFRNGIAGVRIDGRWGFIDRSGSIVIKPEYEQVQSFSEERAWVMRNAKRGMINANGELVVECQFDDARGLNAGMAPAKVDGKAGFVSAAGKCLMSRHSISASVSSAVVKHGETYTYVQRDGQIVCTSQPGDRFNILHNHFSFERQRRTQCVAQPSRPVAGSVVLAP
jgi:WG containing repeat